MAQGERLALVIASQCHGGGSDRRPLKLTGGLSPIATNAVSGNSAVRLHQRFGRLHQCVRGKFRRRRPALEVHSGPGRWRPVQSVARRRPIDWSGGRCLLRHRQSRRDSNPLHTCPWQGRCPADGTASTDESCCSPSVDLGNQYGDYEGLAAGNGVAHPVWTDRRQAVIDLGLREEVFTATLHS